MSSGEKAKGISITAQIVYITAKRKVLGKMIHDECEDILASIHWGRRQLKQMQSQFNLHSGDHDEIALVADRRQRLKRPTGSLLFQTVLKNMHCRHIYDG